MPALRVRRSDKFPVGTVVKAFPGPLNRHHEGKPSGASAGEATVDATGLLAFAADLPEGVYNLWGEVAGLNANLRAGNQGFVAPGVLSARIAARRAEAGA